MDPVGNLNAFEIELETQRGSGEFLDRFKASDWFLDDLVLTPVNALPKAQRRAQCLAAQASLTARIRAYQPLAIVSIMRSIGDIVDEAAVAACGDVPRYVVPSPGNGQQRRFLEAMARIVPAFHGLSEAHRPDPRSKRGIARGLGGSFERQSNVWKCPKSRRRRR